MSLSLTNPIAQFWLTDMKKLLTVICVCVIASGCNVEVKLETKTEKPLGPYTIAFNPGGYAFFSSTKTVDSTTIHTMTFAREGFGKSELEISGGELSVDGKEYGSVADADTIKIDKNQVYINGTLVSGK